VLLISVETRNLLNQNSSFNLSWSEFVCIPLGYQISKFWVWGTSSWPKRLPEPKFQLSSFYMMDRASVETRDIFLHRRQRRVTEGNFLSLKLCYLFIKKSNKIKISEKIIIFLVTNSTKPIHTPYVASKKHFCAHLSNSKK
jgi:hypothetical protein